MRRGLRAARGHGLAVAVMIGLAGLIAASDALFASSAQLIAFLEAEIVARPLAGQLLFVLLAMLSAMLAFFSSALVVPVGLSAWGPFACSALLWTGWLLGGIASFAVGRFLGDTVAPGLLGSRRIASFREQLNGRTRFLHVLLLQAALPSEIPGYVLGIARYPFHRYFAALALTELPYALGTIYLGQSFLARRSVLLLALGLVAIVFSATFYRLFRHGLGDRRGDAHG